MDTAGEIVEQYLSLFSSVINLTFFFSSSMTVFREFYVWEEEYVIASTGTTLPVSRRFHRNSFLTCTCGPTVDNATGSRPTNDNRNSF